MQQVIGFFFIECIPLMTVSAPCQYSKCPDIDLMIWLKINSWKLGVKRTSCLASEKNVFCPHLAILLRNPLPLNGIFAKHAAVIISHIATDCLLLENIVIISQKVPWRKHCKLNKIYPIIMQLHENTHYYAYSFQNKKDKCCWTELIKSFKKLAKHEIFI